MPNSSAQSYIGILVAATSIKLLRYLNDRTLCGRVTFPFFAPMLRILISKRFYLKLKAKSSRISNVQIVKQYCYTS